MPNQVRTYDLIVIGGGPAGVIGAATAAGLGKTVALIDNHHELGGAGINTGTVPSKTLRETALALSGLRSRDLYGIDLSLRREVTVSDFLHHERAVKTAGNVVVSQLLEASGADVHFGLAAFLDANTLSVQLMDRDGERAPAASPELALRGKCILLATGSAPIRPSTYPFGPGVYDSDTILDLDRLPKTVAVLGAGAIGSEYACTFAALDIQVHVIDGRGALLPFLDTEIATALATAMQQSGIAFHWHERVTSCTRDDGGLVTLALSSGAQLVVDAVLVAAGRRGNTDKLRLSAAGVTLGANGMLEVDDQFRTNVPGIFAAGDVIGPPALASTSMLQARTAVTHAFNAGHPATSLRQLPSGVYTIPEIGTFGETEASLVSNQIPYVVGRARYEGNVRGRIVGDAAGFLKLLFRRDDMKLLGVHVIGEQATELVHIGMLATLANFTASALSEACFNAPTLSELYVAAALDALRAAHAPVGLA